VAKTPTCKNCKLEGHYKTWCPSLPRKPVKRSVVRVAVKKVKTPTKKRKESLTAAKKRLEILVKDYVKVRDNYTCQRCGKKVEGSNCHASHVIPVSRSGRLQFDPLNMKVLCYHDHINWWHKHPIEAGEWYTDTFPDRWEYLKAIHKQRLKPMKIDEIKEMIEHYRHKGIDI